MELAFFFTLDVLGAQKTSLERIGRIIVKRLGPSINISLLALLVSRKVPSVLCSL